MAAEADLSSMSSTISVQVEELFDAAILLPASEREFFLQTRCGRDLQLHDRVLSLLAASEQAEDYFSTLGKRLGLYSVFNGELELPQNKTIGAYHLIRLIGRGGMGAVYLAERADQQFEKQVALKILPIGTGGENSLPNFLTERQILARMEHTNIARLLDGGIAEHDTPYFVMEYVDGIPIDEYCNQKALNIDQRLQLFLQVAEAVEYAHRNLVVHRDIKPGNVLVNKLGEVKLVDFGIAKLLEPGTDAAPLTQLGARPMTLIYSSPEAIAGEVVTTAMDVYSLGILLYKLLTGVYPYSTDQNTETDMRNQILSQQAQLPSKAVTKAVIADCAEASGLIAGYCGTTLSGLSRNLSGDLDTIISKALRKKPENRYRSVEQLIADIYRYQQQLPVLARAPGALYRFKKFVRRRTAMVASAAIMLALLISIVVLATQYVITTKEQSEIISKERDTAIQIRDFLISIFESSHPDQSVNQTMTARDLLDRGAKKIQQELSGTPRIQAVLMTTIGDVYFSRTLFNPAKILYQNALEIYRGTEGELSMSYTDTLHGLAFITEQQGDYEAALELVNKALELNEQINNQKGIADNLVLKGRIQQRSGHVEKVAAHFNRALLIYRKLFGNQHESVASCLENLGVLRFQKQDWAGAKELQLESLSIRRSLHEGDAQVVIGNLYALGEVSSEQQLFDEAKAYYLQAIAISIKLIPEGSADISFMYNGLGLVYKSLQQYDQAEVYFRKSAENFRQFMGADHPNRAYALSNLGDTLIKKGEHQAAQSILQESLKIAEEKLPGHPLISALKLNLGICLSANGDYESAERLMQEGYIGLFKAHGINGDETLSAINSMVKFYELWQKPEEAQKFRQLLNNKEQKSG